jgi:hypothetical protein
VLNFVKVLDQRSLRVDIEAEAEGESADRGTWEDKVGQQIMQLCDRLASIANEDATPKLELKYKKGRIGLSEPGKFFHAAVFYPKKTFIVLRMNPAERDSWTQRLDDAELEPQAQKNGRLQIRITPQQFRDNEPLLGELIQQVVKEHQA